MFNRLRSIFSRSKPQKTQEERSRETAKFFEERQKKLEEVQKKLRATQERR